MKRLALLAAATALLATPALAQNAANSGATSQSFITNTSPGTLNTVPSAIAPGLASSVQACLGSKSGAVSFLGGGVGFGGTHPDRDCNLRLNATLLAQLGYSPAAVQVLCNNRDVRLAMAATGTPCVVDRGRVQQVRQQQAPTSPPPGTRAASRAELATLPAGTAYWVNGRRYIKQ